MVGQTLPRHRVPANQNIQAVGGRMGHIAAVLKGFGTGAGIIIILALVLYFGLVLLVG